MPIYQHISSALSHPFSAAGARFILAGVEGTPQCLCDRHNHRTQTRSIVQGHDEKVPMHILLFTRPATAAVILTMPVGVHAAALAEVERRLGSDSSIRFFFPRAVLFSSGALFVALPRLGYVLVDILHLDHAELDVFMAKLQVWG